MLRSGIAIEEADEEDLIKTHAWLRPGDPGVSVTQNSRVTNFVAKRRERIIGYVQLARHPEGNHLLIGYWLFGLRVKTVYRGMGIGKMLCRAVVEKAREEEARELFLLVGEDNHRAINLYRKLGFERKVVSSFKRQLEKEKLSLGYRRIAMSKSLDGENVGDDV